MTLNLVDPETQQGRAVASDRARAAMLLIGLAFLGIGSGLRFGFDVGAIVVGVVVTAAALGLSLRR